MLKSVIVNLRRTCAKNRILYQQQRCRLHGIQQGAKALNDATQIDDFQYFSTKIKELMGNEQLEYFENVVKKVENINHPIADMMK